MADATNLELFVLAMVQLGLGTPYDLKVKAGVSLGSTIPLLARLEKAHLIQGAKAGAHNSRRFTITPAGTKLLKSASWDDLQENVTDVDSALRIAYLAWRFGSRKNAAGVLKSIAERLKAMSGSRISEAKRLSSSLSVSPPPPDAHRWLRMAYDAERLEADAAALSSVARDLMGFAKRKRRKR
jgi:DNA-binding PadR family transcriptional regulator